MRTCSGCRSATRSKGALTMTHRRILVAGGLSLALLAAACHEDALFTTPPPPYAGGAMFQRYVAIGNSITAGFQSGGINDSTQARAYPVLIAAAMGGAPFYRPSLASIPAVNVYGCPPPFDTLFTASGAPHRMGSGSATTCGYRSLPAPPYISNVAVPGATVLD